MTLLCFAVAERTIHRTPSSALRYAYVPSIMLSALAVSLGMLTEYANRPKDFEASLINGKIVTEKIEAITDKENSTEIRIRLLTVLGDSQSEFHNNKILIRLNHKNFQITEGDRLTFRCNLSRITNFANPYEFDYRTYMYRQGYFFTQTLKVEEYKITGHRDDIWTKSKHIQRTLTNLILNSLLSTRTKYTLNTAILGDPTFIDAETRQSFSEAGLAHILAISGLHIGIILTLITLLLRPLDYLKIRGLRITISILTIILFLYITGMSPSAIRATIMSVIVMVALLSHRENNSLNVLCASAIVILIFKPYDIYNVGFQLSFLSVLMIVLLFSKLNTVSPRRKILYYSVSSLLTIILANIGCSIVSAHYFHSLPLLSILSNIFIVPILPLFIGIGIIFIIFSYFGINAPELGHILNWITDCIYCIADFSHKMPVSHINNVSVSVSSIILYFLFIAFIISFIYRHKFSYMICSLVIALISIISATVESAISHHNGFVVLNDHKTSPILYFQNSTGYIWCDDYNIDIDEFKRNYSNLLAKEKINNIYTLNDKSPLNISSPFGILCGKRIAVMSSSKWKHYSSHSPIYIDYLIITKSYYGKIRDIIDLFVPEMVVISGDIYPDKRASLLDECKALHLKHHDIASNGAIFITQ